MKRLFGSEAAGGGGEGKLGYGKMISQPKSFVAKFSDFFGLSYQDMRK